MKKEELEKRTIIVLEKTKKYIMQFGEERKILDKYLIDACNFEEWEEYLLKVEEKIREYNIK